MPRPSVARWLVVALVVAAVLLFRTDPTRDLYALESLDAVIAGGRLYPRGDLDRARSRWEAHYTAPVFDWTSMRLAERLAAGRKP